MDRLDNTVRPYAWGSTTAIPELLGTAPTGEPQAEMWMGAHPGAPSRIDRGDGRVTARPRSSTPTPERELGAAAVDKFGPRLPVPAQAPRRRLPALPPGPPRPRPGAGGLRRRGGAAASPSTPRTATTRTPTTSPN